MFHLECIACIPFCGKQRSPGKFHISHLFANLKNYVVITHSARKLCGKKYIPMAGIQHVLDKFTCTIVLTRVVFETEPQWRWALIHNSFEMFDIFVHPGAVLECRGTLPKPFQCDNIFSAWTLSADWERSRNDCKFAWQSNTRSISCTWKSIIPGHGRHEIAAPDASEYFPTGHNLHSSLIGLSSLDTM